MKYKDELEITPPDNPPTLDEIMAWLENPSSNPTLEKWFQENKEKFSDE